MIDNIGWPKVLNETWNHYDEWAGDDFQRRMAVVNYIPGKLNLTMILLFTFLDIIRIVITPPCIVEMSAFNNLGV